MIMTQLTRRQRRQILKHVVLGLNWLLWASIIAWFFIDSDSFITNILMIVTWVFALFSPLLYLVVLGVVLWCWYSVLRNEDNF